MLTFNWSTTHRICGTATGESIRESRPDVQQGRRDLMVLKKLESTEPLHGYGIARRIERVIGNALRFDQGTIYPAAPAPTATVGSQLNGVFGNRPPRKVLLSEPVWTETNCSGDLEPATNCYDDGAVSCAVQLGVLHVWHTVMPCQRTPYLAPTLQDQG
jgi:hypothetical protein